MFESSVTSLLGGPKCDPNHQIFFIKTFTRRTTGNSNILSFGEEICFENAKRFTKIGATEKKLIDPIGLL